MDQPAPLNPAQQEVVALLGATGGERPAFDATLRDALRDQLEAELAPLLDRLPDEALWVNKRKLSQVHGCEVQYLGEQTSTFSWSVPVARGTIAHKAIQLGVSWQGQPIPAELVTEVMARATEGLDSLGEWLRTCGEADRAELRSEATMRVTSFFECFPPLKMRWRPSLESPARVDLLGGRITLAGRVDLSLGQATDKGKVLIDFKTGGFSPIHIDDLRFYALVETIRLGTPPRLVASYYLDSARPHPETVTLGLLEAALARTVDGVTRMVDLLHQPEQARTRTSTACSWCGVLTQCVDGQVAVAEANDRSGVAVMS